MMDRFFLTFDGNARIPERGQNMVGEFNRLVTEKYGEADSLVTIRTMHGVRLGIRDGRFPGLSGLSFGSQEFRELIDALAKKLDLSIDEIDPLLATTVRRRQRAALLAGTTRLVM